MSAEPDDLLQRAARFDRRDGRTDDIVAPPTNAAADNWPVLAPEALDGLPGEIVRAIDPYTEADPVAVLVNLLVMFGNALNRGPHAAVGDVWHAANLNAVFVGITSKGRKGTAQATPKRLMAIADPEWAATRITGGLASGEGLIHAVRDPVMKTEKDGTETVADPGVKDKRLLVVEEEFSSVLKVAGREGNTLSEVVRRAWDGSTLQNMTRNSPARATGAHVSLIGHITKDELLREMDSTDAANGVANRFGWFCVRRSKSISRPVRFPDDLAQEYGARLRRSIDTARKRGELTFDDEAGALWDHAYPALSEGKPGMLGAITGRSEAQTLRKALNYALIDEAAGIRVNHLLAALALWDYAEASARFIFGDATGDPVADLILTTLRDEGPKTQTDIYNLFSRHKNAGRIGTSLAMLQQCGKAIAYTDNATGGRPRVVWSTTGRPDPESGPNSARRGKVVL